jgi:hypothetical protein
MIGTNDLNKAIKFYDTLLETIDLKRVITNEKYIGYSSKEKPLVYLMPIKPFVANLSKWMMILLHP